MSLRCACPDDENAHVDGGWRDPYVFGPCVTCARSSARQTTLPKLVPSWMFTVPEEPPWTTTLGPDEVYE